MCILQNLGNMGNDTPHLQCDGCDMVFSIYWTRNLIYDQPEYCPFCGDEIEEIIWDEKDE
jgi:uncharacterized paraquat-inducible protein A